MAVIILGSDTNSEQARSVTHKRVKNIKKQSTRFEPTNKTSLPSKKELNFIELRKRRPSYK